MNHRKLSSSLALAAIVVLGWLPRWADAHFIWLVPVDGEMRVVFGEGPEPGDAALIDRVTQSEVWQRVDGADWAVELERKIDGEHGWLRCADVRPGAEMALHCRYGVLDRGGQSMLLNYWGKYATLVDGRTTSSANPAGSEKLRLDLVPWFSEEGLCVKIVWDGAAQPDCEVHVLGDGPLAGVHKSDAEGTVRLPAGEWQRLALRAAVSDDSKSGELDGKTYSLEKHHVTLVVDQVAETAVASAPAGPVLAELPLGLTSFGAVLANDQIVLFGGQTAGAHSYWDKSQNGELLWLGSAGDAAWHRTDAGRGVQGLGMVSHGTRVYRLGGFEARNAEGQPDDLHSLADCAWIDVKVLDGATAAEWQPAPPLPEPRSSFDACIVDDTVFVAGGWTLNGDQPSVWCESACSLNLADPESGWQALPKPPFQRRALSLGYQGKRLYAIGGMEESGDISNAVNVLDLEKGEWSDGPSLPEGGPMEGFGTACCTVAGRLVISTYGGTVYRLSEAGDAWEKVHQLPTARFFHRLLPWGEDAVLVVGGTNMESGKKKDLVVVPVGS
jgi:Kelch motif